jgi:hypothetical protein
MKLYPLPCYLVPLRSKYSPQHPILKHTRPTFFLQCQQPNLTPTEERERLNYYITTTREDNLSSQMLQCISKTLILIVLCRQAKTVNYCSHHPKSISNYSAPYLWKRVCFIIMAFETHEKNWVETLSLIICHETSDFILIMKHKSSRPQKCALPDCYVTLNAELHARLTLALLNESCLLFAAVTLSPKGDSYRYLVKRSVGNHSRLRRYAPANIKKPPTAR